MISRVLLRNWRGYEKLRLEFGPGLTFVIADNGVGKTSLINGVAWALFGSTFGVDGSAGIRAGEDETSAEVDLDVGDRHVSLSRSLSRDRGRKESLTVRLDGDEVAAESLDAILTDALDAPRDILARIMFVPEMQLPRESDLFADVQDHVAALLGIASLRDSANVARQTGASAAKRIRLTKAAVKVDSAATEIARTRAAEIRADIEGLTSSVTEATARRAEIELALRRVQEWTSYEQRVVLYNTRLASLRDRADKIGLSIERDVITAAEQQTLEEDNALRTELAEAKAQEALVEDLLQQLNSADAVCPVCLQSLPEDRAQHASSVHRQRLSALARRREATQGRRAQVQRAGETLHAIASALSDTRPPDRPEVPRPEHTEADLVSQQAEVDDTLSTRNQELGTLREQLHQVERTLRDAESAQAATSELTRLHAISAAAASLAQIADVEANVRTERSLRPLSSALAERWSEFFVGRGAPRLARGGSIELGHGHAIVPYASFSGGEKTLASLLTRLLFATSATGIETMWLDEPLEHLDPTNRVRAVKLLADIVSSRHRMRQVVVTTYEEALARSMATRYDNTAIVYVSTDELL